MTMKTTLILGLLFAGLILAINSLQQLNFPAKNHQGIYHSRLPFQELRVRRARNQLVVQNTGFACLMYRELVKKSGDKNLFFSPLSLSTGFSMLSLGAKDSALSQLIDSLNLKDLPRNDIHQGFHHLIHDLNQPDRNLKFHVGNTLFVEEELKIQEKFLDGAKSMYEAEIVPIDFKDTEKARSQMNDYISQKTHGQITNLIKNMDSGTMLILISHIYFQAEWERQFNPKDTEEEEFFLINGKSVKVPMMYRGGKYKTGYDEKLSCTILEMPYKGNVTGLFILPEKGKLKNVEEVLRKETLTHFRKSLTCSSVDVSLPKFSISGTYNMKECLSGLGAKKIFDGSADLTGISPDKILKVSQAMQKAVLKIDEKGTEAAGGTSIEALPMASPTIIKLDHPFIFIVIDDLTESLLFMGRIMNPK